MQPMNALRCRLLPCMRPRMTESQCLLHYMSLPCACLAVKSIISSSSYSLFHFAFWLHICFPSATQTAFLLICFPSAIHTAFLLVDHHNFGSAIFIRYRVFQTTANDNSTYTASTTFFRSWPWAVVVTGSPISSVSFSPNIQSAGMSVKTASQTDPSTISTPLVLQAQLPHPSS
jgi:hypothetical protein